MILFGGGEKDLIAGNHGLNSVFRASNEHLMEIWVGDLDRNGRYEQVIVGSGKEGSYPVLIRDDLIGQIPKLNSRYPSYESYAGQ